MVDPLANVPLAERSEEHRALALKASTKAVPIDQWPMTFVIDVAEGTGVEGQLQAHPEGLLFVGRTKEEDDPETDVVYQLAMAKATIRGLALAYRFRVEDANGGEPRTIEREVPVLIVDKEGGGYAFDSPFVIATARRIGELLDVSLHESR